MANKRPVVANLDFQDIKNDIIAYFSTHEEFKDYEFTGSALNLLIEILAYNTHYNSLAANMVVNEMFLDSALMRSSVVSIAKALNYIPRSVTSAKSSLSLYVPRNSTEQFYVLPAGTTFTASSGNNSKNFFTIRDYVVQYEVGETFNTLPVEIHEGALVTQRFVNTTSTNKDFTYFDLLNDFIDTSTFTVTVNGEKWTQITPEAEGITSTNNTSKIFFIEETRGGKPRLMFGNGVIGQKLNVGDVVVASFIVTTGAEGNGISSFSVTVPGRADIRIQTGTTTVSQGGSDRETIREIKQNAPKWYAAQYRAVSSDDYETIIKKRYADVKSIKVFGGEEIDKPGKVYIAIRPKSSDYLSDATKTTIVNEILSDTNVVTITPEVINPKYIDIILKTVVTYDDNLLVSNRDTLKAKVQSLYNAFNTNNLGNFGEDYRNSKFTREVYDLDDSVVSANTRVSLKYSLTAKDSYLNTYSWSFGNRLYHPEAGYKSSTGGILSSNLFQRVSQPNYRSGLDEDGNGKIRLYDYIDSSKLYVSFDAGTINYETGEIEISNTIDFSDGTVEINVVPDSFDVIAENEVVLRISTSGSLVDAIEQNDEVTLKNINVSRSS